MSCQPNCPACQYDICSHHLPDGYTAVEDTVSRIYTRQDIVRAVLAQQWAIAIAVAMSAKPKQSYLSAVLSNPALFPCAIDVVAALEKT
jgi:hypothetical protein